MGGQLGRLFGGKTEEEIEDTLSQFSEQALMVIFSQLSVSDLITKVPLFGEKYARLSKRRELWQPRYYALLRKEYTEKDIDPPEIEDDRYQNSPYPWYDRFIDLWIDRPHIWRDSLSGRITGAAAWYRDNNTGQIVSYPIYWIELDSGTVNIVQSRKIEEDCPDIYIQVPGMINTMFNLNDPTNKATVPYDAARVDITCINDRYSVWEQNYIAASKALSVAGFVGTIAQYLASYADQVRLIDYYDRLAGHDAEYAYYFMRQLGSNDPFPLLETVSSIAQNINPFLPTQLDIALIGATAILTLTHKAIFKAIAGAGIDLNRIDSFASTAEIPNNIACIPVYILFTDAMNTRTNTRVVELSRFGTREVVESPVFEHTEQSYLGMCISCGISSQLLYKSEGTDNIYCSKYCQEKIE